MKTNNEKWEKEFEEEFYKKDDAIFDRQGNNISRQVKQFLIQKLNEQAEEFKKCVPAKSNCGSRDINLQERLTTDVSIPTYEVAEFSYYCEEKGRNQAISEMNKSIKESNEIT